MDTSVVFAYGSNMDFPDLTRWAIQMGRGTPNILEFDRAVLRDFERVWNYRSAARGGGAANVQPCPGAEVWGLALQVDGPTLALMDAKEGHPGRYSRGTAPLALYLPDRGTECAAWVYQVTPEFLIESGCPPTRAYLGLILQAAKKYDLPAEEIRRLEATVVV